MSVARRCVPDPEIDPEIEALITHIDALHSAICALKTEATQLYEIGQLDPQTAIKYEVKT